MENNNNRAALEENESFCSDCKLVLKSIYSIGTASSINECESFIDGKSRDRNSCVQSLKKEIINKDNDKFKHSQLFFFSKNELPSPTLHANNHIISQEKIPAMLHKKLKEEYIPDSYIKYPTRIKPIIVEDKILQSSEQLNINNWKKQKSETSSYKHSDTKDSKQHKTIKYVNTNDTQSYQNITNDCTDLKTVYGINIQSGQLTQNNLTESLTHPIPQNIERDIHTTMTPDYISQYNILQTTISNRRKRISEVAQNLLTLSSYLDGICKTILKTEELNPSLVHTNISYNLSKKEDKGTSPIVLSQTRPAVTNLIPNQGNDHDMYSYNPYRSKNISQKKI
ncbi:hypothetical protein KPH14_006419 [Odynerus spinipes]|uniref:Uncharacterized protein n=1 Tax=Odynerus spinipes TaxID=1348599 RepID=A0AAD9RZZ4_9HYME|nr:hypothetical protein KPH14_006419 [Odynerus spinipes]